MRSTPIDSSCATMRQAPTEILESDICVVGGGISGVTAALAAARSGSTVTLVQDRPMLGGNASSEVRMWICGAHGRFNKEAGILEELQLENYYRNPGLKYTVWDTVHYEKVRAEKNIRLLLNCSVCEVETEGANIQSVLCWHLTRQCWVQIQARIFIDCSGDSILRLSGAHHRWGREASEAYGESLGLPVADRKTMGNSILIQLREIDPADHRPFIAPDFAVPFNENHPRAREARPAGHNFWWIEVGGEQDTIGDADAIRDELYGIAFGVWAFIKNHPDGRGHKWELEWIGSLPGKRENVRYTGAYNLRQQDLESGGHFDDIIAYGGWTMDDHPPAAFHHVGDPTQHYGVPSPYGIPYGCLYGAGIDNLMFAGRNISATHMALSSTRVMGTCSLLGQAAGTAAAMACQKGVLPKDIGENYIGELQNRLMEADQWLPGLQRALPDLTQAASVSGKGLTGEVTTLQDGHERRQEDGDHWVELAPGGFLEFSWESAQTIDGLRLVVDSNLHDTKRQPCNYPLGRKPVTMPAAMPKTLSVQSATEGGWQEIARVENNRRRLIQVPLQTTTTALRVVMVEAWGGDKATIFACEVGKVDYASAPVRVDWPGAHQTGGRSHA